MTLKLSRVVGFAHAAYYDLGDSTTYAILELSALLGNSSYEKSKRKPLMSFRPRQLIKKLLYVELGKEILHHIDQKESGHE